MPFRAVFPSSRKQEKEKLKKSSWNEIHDYMICIYIVIFSVLLISCLF